MFTSLCCWTLYNVLADLCNVLLFNGCKGSMERGGLSNRVVGGGDLGRATATWRRSVLALRCQWWCARFQTVLWPNQNDTQQARCFLGFLC